MGNMGKNPDVATFCGGGGDMSLVDAWVTQKNMMSVKQRIEFEEKIKREATPERVESEFRAIMKKSVDEAYDIIKTGKPKSYVCDKLYEFGKTYQRMLAETTGIRLNDSLVQEVAKETVDQVHKKDSVDDWIIESK